MYHCFNYGFNNSIQLHYYGFKEGGGTVLLYVWDIDLGYKVPTYQDPWKYKTFFKTLYIRMLYIKSVAIWDGAMRNILFVAIQTRRTEGE